MTRFHNNGKSAANAKLKVGSMTTNCD